MRKFVLFLTLMLAGSAWAQTLRPADLTEGGYILYFRHGRADLGRDCKDSNRGEWWKSNDPTLTRQLEEEGKRQAKIIGQAFRRLDIPVGAVLSSEFKRALETARLMGLKEVVPERALTPLTAYGEFAPRLESLLLTEPEAGTNTVLVAHGHVLPMFEELTEGSAVVFRPGRTEPVGVIAYEDWEPVAGNLLFDSQNPDDRYILEDSVLTVRSHRGIGTVTLTPLSDSWPSLEKIRFEYADGRGMKVLEGLRINTGSPNPRNDYFDLSKVLNEGALEVKLPHELPGSIPFITIHWVDFYR